MKQMSITKFAKAIQSDTIHSILFNSIHQSSCILSDVSVDGEFGKISVMSNPNRILLSNPGDDANHRICFNRVKAIIDYRSNESEDVSDFGIICGCSSNNNENTVYKISIIKNM